jgi:ribosomal protein S18 acetylase RimI-like enzyme
VAGSRVKTTGRAGAADGAAGGTEAGASDAGGGDARAEDIRIRVATLSDIPAVLGLWSVARSAAARTPDDAAGVERLLERSPDGLLVAECDGQLVGVIIATWDGWRGNMYRLAVLPEFRRQGFGRRLVEAGHERLRAKGARRVTALVGNEEAEAMALWVASDYERDDLIVRFVRNF